MGNVNPWLGWSSYDEESLKNGYHFVGRSAEISELFSLIDNNLLVTLYGKSGIGKSSLLNAGVFPSLRAADYVPVICRWGDSSYPQNIIGQIESQCELASDCDLSRCSNLVEFFRNTEFSRDGKSVFPVLVFDQFEDWFRADVSSVERLLSDISFLISAEYEGVTNYRFVLSIREDYLYLLEDAIDRLQRSELKENRYRLTDLTAARAEEILDLGDIDNDVKHRLMQISKDGYGYNPGLLSFFCHELFLLYSGRIPADALSHINDGNSLIEKYYDRCFNNKAISVATKDYIESRMQEDGMRRPQNLNSVARHIPAGELRVLLHGNNKMLRKFPVGGVEHVELIHDRIAEIINARRARAANVQRDRAIGVTLTIYYIAIGFLVWNIIIDILHAAWGYMDDNYIPYCKELLGEDQAWQFIGDLSSSFSDLILFRAMALVTLLLFLAYVIPLYICSLFYNKLSIPRMFVAVWGIVFAAILSSSWFLKVSIIDDTWLYFALGVAIFFFGVIAFDFMQKRNNRNEKQQ